MHTNLCLYPPEDKLSLFWRGVFEEGKKEVSEEVSASAGRAVPKRRG